MFDLIQLHPASRCCSSLELSQSLPLQLATQTNTRIISSYFFLFSLSLSITAPLVQLASLFSGISVSQPLTLMIYERGMISTRQETVDRPTNRPRINRGSLNVLAQIRFCFLCSAFLSHRISCSSGRHPRRRLGTRENHLYIPRANEK